MKLALLGLLLAAGFVLLRHRRPRIVAAFPETGTYDPRLHVGWSW